MPPYNENPQVPNEAAVFLAAVRWATSPPLLPEERTAREAQVPQIISDCVRLSLLSYPQLEQLDQDPLVSAKSLTLGWMYAVDREGGPRGWHAGGMHARRTADHNHAF